MLEFEFLWAFALLPLPLLIHFFSPHYREHSEAVRVPFFQRVASLGDEKPSQGSIVKQKKTWQIIVVCLSWLLIILALAKPVLVKDPIVREFSARDMLLMVDLSGSMEEEDFTNADGENISRLDAVKAVLNGFIERRSGDRLGLTVFGNAAFPQTSFTDDMKTVETLLDELQPRMAGPQTMIGDAIGLAIRLFDASTKDDKVAILLTDGNDTGSQMPVGKAAQIAADNDIVIHTIAMGNPETVGEKALDLPLLKNISDITGGQFFVALNGDELNAIYDELDRIEPVLLDTVSYRPKVNVFYIPIVLLLGLNILLMLIFNQVRRSRTLANA